MQRESDRFKVTFTIIAFLFHVNGESCNFENLLW